MAKVLALVTFNVFPPKMGGQKGVALFYQYLQKHHNIIVAASKDNKGTAFSFLYNNKRLYLNSLLLFRLRKIVRNNAIDLLIAEHSYAGWLAWLLSCITGKPFIIHSHNIEAFRFREMNKKGWKFYQHYEKWIHKKASFNFFISAEDEKYAIQQFGISPDKCAVITYGTNLKSAPVNNDKRDLKKRAGYKEEEMVLLFNGTLDYEPNLEAVNTLLYKINPILNQYLKNYKIVITGNRASTKLIQQLTRQVHIEYKGYVDDIDPYYEAADLFLNPITNSSGIKTKVIEAIAHNCTVISFEGGAAGVKKEVCGKKLQIIQNNNYRDFAAQVIKNSGGNIENTPASFYSYYNWEGIAEKAAAHITAIVNKETK